MLVWFTRAAAGQIVGEQQKMNNLQVMRIAALLVQIIERDRMAAARLVVDRNGTAHEPFLQEQLHVPRGAVHRTARIHADDDLDVFFRFPRSLRYGCSCSNSEKTTKKIQQVFVFNNIFHAPPPGVHECRDAEHVNQVCAGDAKAGSSILLM